jgi:hypothetical protein
MRQSESLSTTKGMWKRNILVLSILLFVLDDCIAFQLQGAASTEITSVRKGFRTRIRISPLRMGSTKNISVDALLEVEKEVIASTQAKLDLKRVTSAFDVRESSEIDPEKVAILAEPWKIAMAAAIAVSLLAFTIMGSTFLSVVTFIGVFFLANGDPLEEEGVAGSFARLLGRLTIQSVETSKPKLRAVARAAITNEDEILRLNHEVVELQKEKASLALWKQRRLAVDESVSYYTHEALKQKARENDLLVGGSKSQLMMRLLEAELLEL